METVKNMYDKQDNSRPLQVNPASFDTEVLTSELPVLAAFAMQWRRTCQIVESALKAITSSCSKKLKYTDENLDFGPWYGIQPVPTLVCVTASKFVGTATKVALLAQLEPLTHADEYHGESRYV